MHPILAVILGLFGLGALFFIAFLASLKFTKSGQYATAQLKLPPHQRDHKLLGSLYAIWSKDKNQDLQLWFTTDQFGVGLKSKFNVFYYKHSTYSSHTHHIVKILEDTHYDENLHQRYSERAHDSEEQRLRAKALDRRGSFQERDVWLVLDRVDGRLKIYALSAEHEADFLASLDSDPDLVKIKAQSFARLYDADASAYNVASFIHFAPEIKTTSASARQGEA